MIALRQMLGMIRLDFLIFVHGHRTRTSVDTARQVSRLELAILIGKILENSLFCAPFTKFRRLHLEIEFVQIRTRRCFNLNTSI